ncbi:MAG: hypothetical protein ACR2IV_05845 [Bryobacteraceae bacterium]
MLKAFAVMTILPVLMASGGPPPVRSIGVLFDGDSSAIVSGKTVYFAVPFGCTIQGWDMTIDAGAASIDIWKRGNDSSNPTYLNSITASNTPAITQGYHVHSTNLAGWSTSVSPYDDFGFYLKFASGGVTQASLVLQCQ